MRRNIRYLLSAAALALAGKALAIDGPWMDMFNGSTLAGWEGNPALWKTGEGAITATGEITENTFLIWKEAESDFVLEIDARVPGTGEANSGIQFRSQTMPAVGAQRWKVCGPQADIGPEKHGALYNECSGRVIPPDSSKCKTAGRADGWNHYQLKVDGPRWTLKMNDVICFDYTEKNPAAKAVPGTVALQYHAPGYALGFKNIRMKRLNLPATGIAAPPGADGEIKGRAGRRAHGMASGPNPLQGRFSVLGRQTSGKNGYEKN
jgi:hypothetical protein